MAGLLLLCLGLKRPFWSAVMGRRETYLMRKPRSGSWCSRNGPWSHMQRCFKVKLRRGREGRLIGCVVGKGAQTCEEPGSRDSIEARVVWAWAGAALSTPCHLSRPSSC